MKTPGTKKAADKSGTADLGKTAGTTGISEAPAGKQAASIYLSTQQGKVGTDAVEESQTISGAAKLHGRSMARVVAVLVLLIAVYALYERPGAVEWLFAAVVILTAGFGLLLPYLTLGRIQAERTVYNADDLADGGEMRVLVSLKLTRMLPFLWICLQEEIVNTSIPEAKGIKIIRALLPGFSRQLTLSYTVNGLQRGVLEFRRITVSTGDMLGLSARTATVDCPGRAVVRPASPPGEHLGALPGFEAEQTRQGMQPVSSFGGQMMSAASRLRRDGAGPELRTYVPGDSLRRVDWRAMARGLGMQTRMNEAEEAGTVIVLLEMSEAAYGKDRRLFDANAGRALAIMKQAEREGRRLKLLTNSLDEGVIHDGDSGGAALREVGKSLAQLRLGAASKPMSQRLSDVIAGAPRGASIICLTAGKAGSADAIARPSGDSGNISYGAKLAGVRGIRLLLLLSIPASGSDAEERWRERLQGTGCTVRAMPVSESYGSQRPKPKEAAARSGRERSEIHVEAANR